MWEPEQAICSRLGPEVALVGPWQHGSLYAGSPSGYIVAMERHAVATSTTHTLDHMFVKPRGHKSGCQAEGSYAVLKKRVAHVGLSAHVL